MLADSPQKKVLFHDCIKYDWIERRKKEVAVKGGGKKKSMQGGKKKEVGKKKKYGLVRESNPGPLAPKARIMPLDQQATSRADVHKMHFYILPMATYCNFSRTVDKTQNGHSI